METQCIFCEIGSGILNIILKSFLLQRVKETGCCGLDSTA
jgi:hypothetical protein